MSKPDFTLKFIKDSNDLRLLSERLITLPVFALDIETSEWWNRHRERIALLQFAYRAGGKIRIVILDALAEVDFELLRVPLENPSIQKIIHNAGFDAVRLSKHYNFKTAPVFDTMNAARRNGERKYSLKAQAGIHLNIHLDKSVQNSDWSRRPLDLRQLNYAALDPYATLLLYENQLERGLSNDYRLKPIIESEQSSLPLDDFPVATPKVESIRSKTEDSYVKAELSGESIAVLGIVTGLPNRYHPEGLAASVGSERVGLAGWIIDRRLGIDSEPDEETIRLAIAALCEKGLIRITESQRMEATETGERVWKELKI